MTIANCAKSPNESYLEAVACGIWRDTHDYVVRNQHRTHGPRCVHPTPVEYRVKVPLTACSADGATGVRIPSGSRIEWLPRALVSRGLAGIRWLQEDYLVSSAELNQNCERIEGRGAEMLAGPGD